MSILSLDLIQPIIEKYISANINSIRVILMPETNPLLYEFYTYFPPLKILNKLNVYRNKLEWNEYATNYGHESRHFLIKFRSLRDLEVKLEKGIESSYLFKDNIKERKEEGRFNCIFSLVNKLLKEGKIIPHKENYCTCDGAQGYSFRFGGKNFSAFVFKKEKLPEEITKRILEEYDKREKEKKELEDWDYLKDYLLHAEANHAY